MTKRPLADRMRPTNFDEMVGQAHLVGKNGALRRMLQRGFLPNMIFYGPPGTGKTTAANILAAASDMHLYKLNATTAKLSDIHDILAQTSSMFGVNGILLYLDEIQYFNKKQQQTLLEFMEDGRITLIASTTENPYFYVYGALRSRATIFSFEPVDAQALMPLLHRALVALQEDGLKITANDEVLLSIARQSAGDVRRALGTLEICAYMTGEDGTITPEMLAQTVSAGVGVFDRDGDGHYDLLSCLQKSIRGSDPDASVFYLAKLLEGGELNGVCRRLQVIAAEDVGLAYPIAYGVVRACVEAARELGMPEARIALAQATLLLATAPKSNSAMGAYDAAAADVRAGNGTVLPPHLRDAHYAGAEKLGHGTSYRYAHDYPNHYVAQQYLPDDLRDKVYYQFGENKTEQAAKGYLARIKSEDQTKK